MTAQRWWVRAFARWQARIDSVKGQIQAVSLAVTAYSTFSLLLQNVGLGRWVPVLGGALLLAGPAYAYLFFEGGVWNQVARDRADMSSNYAAPNARINSELTARGLAARDKGETLTERERDVMRQELDATFDDLRDGVQLDD
jgi:hypothetical protein